MRDWDRIERLVREKLDAEVKERSAKMTPWQKFREQEIIEQMIDLFEQAWEDEGLSEDEKDARVETARKHVTLMHAKRLGLVRRKK